MIKTVPEVSTRENKKAHQDGVSFKEPPLKENKEYDIQKAIINAILIPAVGALIYGAAYITGLVYHQDYLSEYGIPVDLFPQQPKDYLLFAYIATLKFLTSALNLASNYKIWLGLTFLIATIFFYILLVKAIANSKKIEEKIEKRLKKVIKWKKTAIATLVTLFSASLSTLILATPAVLFLLLAIPIQLGSYGAKIVAQKEKHDFELGCKPQNGSTERCHSISNKYGTIQTGHIIAVSTTHIAIYKNGKSYIYPIADNLILEIREN